MQLDGENQCLKAAQDCGLYEKCGSLRSEYVLACTKRVPGTTRCNQHKCHRALRRFLERVPEEYSLGVLFCPCTNTLCGERRRKTIVPSCSYQEMEGLQPNCLHQQSFCRRDDLCRLDTKPKQMCGADAVCKCREAVKWRYMGQFDYTLIVKLIVYVYVCEYLFCNDSCVTKPICFLATSH